MKLVEGFWWPDADVHCHPIVLKTVKDADAALQHTLGHVSVVQAGGNCGVWASYLGERFMEVWTIEPDLENYLCLIRNIPQNVYPIWAALGCHPGTTGLDTDPKNVGAHQMNGNGRIPVITIDELGLTACDLICLDIEGMEPAALDGAKETIERFRPTLMVEDKGLSERYGVAKGWSDSLPGYQVAKRVHRDVVLVPE